MAFQNILPDPFNAITPHGEVTNSGSNAAFNPVTAVGYATIQVGSNQKIMKDRTNSGIVVTRATAYHMFTASIAYNPMPKSFHDILYSFLMDKQASLRPFYVSLPQNTTFSGAAEASSKHSIKYAQVAGARQLLLEDSGGEDNITVTVGDMFNVVDSNGLAVNSHTKAYQVTRVEEHGAISSSLTSTTAGATTPNSGQLQKRITFTPSLQKSVTTSEFVEVGKPKLFVLQTGNVQTYSLNADNLYSLSVKVEEACF